MGQATLSPGQLSRKETPPLQQAAGPGRAFGWRWCHRRHVPLPPPTYQSPNLSLSSLPAFQPYIPALHPHTAHASSHQENIRGQFSPWIQGRWISLSRGTAFCAGLFCIWMLCETQTDCLWNYHTKKKVKDRVKKLRPQLIIIFMIDCCLDYYFRLISSSFSL